MKTINTISISILLAHSLFAQTINTSPLPTGTITIGNHLSAGYQNELWSNSTSLYFNKRGNTTATYFWNKTNNSPLLAIQNTGRIGMGTSSPNFDLHIHGLYEEIEQTTTEPNNSSKATKYVKIARIGLTNTLGGSTVKDGVIFQLRGNDFTLANQESGTFSIASNGSLSIYGGTTRLSLIDGKSYFGTNYKIKGMENGLVNVMPNTSSDNGLFIRLSAPNHYGLSIKMGSDLDNAILVTGQKVGTYNFEVKGNGSVYARKYTTTLANFPDYVFNTEYKLLPFAELRKYIATHHRLPSMPAAKQIHAEGVDIGELNRLLVEKVEELTLYVLQLESRLNLVEKNNE